MPRVTGETIWAVVLAAGEGTRLAPITRVLYGRSIPKQFAALDGDRSFLQRTMDRVGLVVPPERTMVVVSHARAALAHTQLAEYRGVEVIEQPADRGTGPGVLLPLAHVLRRDPGGRVVIFPSDHHVGQPERLIQAVARALCAAEAAPSGLALVGAQATRAATDLGWMVPGARLCQAENDCRCITRFVEKPDAAMAADLRRQGALWNTFIVAASGKALWRLARRHIPTQTRGFERYRRQLPRPGASGLLERLYEEMAGADFCRDILQRADGLGMASLESVEWSDCGTPERLFEALSGTPGLSRLMTRLNQASLVASSPQSNAAVA